MVDERGMAKNFEDAGPLELTIYVKLAVAHWWSPQKSTNLDTCAFHKLRQPQAFTQCLNGRLTLQTYSSAAAAA